MMDERYLTKRLEDALMLMKSGRIQKARHVIENTLYTMRKKTRRVEDEPQANTA